MSDKSPSPSLCELTSYSTSLAQHMDQRCVQFGEMSLHIQKSNPYSADDMAHGTMGEPATVGCMTPVNELQMRCQIMVVALETAASGVISIPITRCVPFLRMLQHEYGRQPCFMLI
jgi:hypothetical protein